MQMMTPEQIARIYTVTDQFALDRNLVIIPLKAHDDGLEMIMPDGKLLVRGPPGKAFDPWFAGLAERLGSMDLSRARVFGGR
jgi:hypothetical protein